MLFLALQQKIDMSETLKFPLKPVSLCLAYIDGLMLKTPKSFLLKEQTAQVISEARSNIDTFATNNIFILRLRKE